MLVLAPEVFVSPPPDFAEFYAARFRPLTIQLYGYVGDLAEAQDLMQEAFCRALMRWSKVSAFEDPEGWVRRVATNLAHSRWRRIKRSFEVFGGGRPPILPGPSPEHVDLVAALLSLPDNQRRAVVMYYLGDMPVSEIASVVGAAEGTVKSWLHRGRTALAKQLSIKEEETLDV